MGKHPISIPLIQSILWVMSMNIAAFGTALVTRISVGTLARADDDTPQLSTGIGLVSRRLNGRPKGSRAHGDGLPSKQHVQSLRNQVQ